MIIINGAIASQFFREGAAPPVDIIMNSLSINKVGTTFIASYTTTGATEKNQLPIATGVQITGRKNEGQVINGVWEYFHINNSLEGATTIVVETATNEGFTVGVTTIGTSFPITLAGGSSGKYLRLAVTPKTSDGTTGTTVYSDVYLIGNAIIQKQIRISLGPAGKAFSNIAWNNAHTDNPDGTYDFFIATGNYLKNSDEEIIANLNLDVDLAMSDSAAGAINAGIEGASEFIAGVCDGLWYSTGTRGFQIKVPPGGLGIGIGEIKLCCAISSGTNVGTYSVNGGSQIVLSDITRNTPNSNNIANFTNVDMSGDITIRAIDGTGICPINALILYYYVES